MSLGRREANFCTMMGDPYYGDDYTPQDAVNTDLSYL